MPQGREITHIDVALTNLSELYTQELGGFQCHKLFPTIATDKQTNIYYKYDKGDFFRSDVKKRADKTESAGTDYDVAKGEPYMVETYALHELISDRDVYNADNPLDLDSDAVRHLTEQFLISQEQDFVDRIVKRGIWNTELAGVDTVTDASKQVLKFSNPVSDPVKMVRKLKREMLKNTGKKPNVMLLSADVYDELLDNEEINSKIKVTQDKIANKDLLARLFEIDEIIVSEAIFNKANRGEEADMDFILNGGVMLMLYRPATPGLRQVSAGYTFNWTKLNVQDKAINGISVSRMYNADKKATKIEAEIGYDIKVTCPDLGIYLDNLV